MTYQVCHERQSQQEGTDTLRIRASLRMNSPSFTSQSTTEDRENIVEQLKKAFDVRYVFDVETVELVVYQLKNVVRIWFDQWNICRDDNAPHPSWAFFEESFLGHFIHRELKEVKVQEFLTLK